MNNTKIYGDTRVGLNQDMFKMSVMLDEQAVSSDNWNVESYRKCVENLLESYELVKNSDGLYYGQRDEKDATRFGAAIISLSNCSWFKPSFFKQWILYERNDFQKNDAETEFIADDCIASYRECRLEKV